MARSRRDVDPYLCPTGARLRWVALGPAALTVYVVVVFLILALGTGYLLGSGPLRQVVEVPGPTVTVTVTAPSADSP